MNAKISFILLLVALLIGTSVTFAATTNLSVTIVSTTTDDGGDDDTGGGGGPGEDDPVLGCTDAAATNYNSSATEDDGSCEYPEPEPVPNGTNFSVNYLPSINQVALTWSNPAYAELAAARVVRGVGVIPSSPTDGQLIYDGPGEGATDGNVLGGTTYFYVLFIRNLSGEYSSGVVDNLTIPVEEEPPPEDEEEAEEDDEEEDPADDGTDDTGAGGDGGDGSGGSGGGDRGSSSPSDGSVETPPDPFEFFPTVIDRSPILRRLDLGDFVFSQTGERPKFFRFGDRIVVAPDKEITVSIDYRRLPEALKIVGVSLTDSQSTPPKVSSYLLRVNQAKTAYAAELGILPRGLYGLAIHIVNLENRTVKRLRGELLVGSAGLAALPQVAVEAGEPVVLAVGLGSGLVQAFSLAGHLKSLSDFYLIILHFWSLVLRALGLRRRYKPWGVVYDSVTKRPLDPAYVVVNKGEEDTATAITDLDGRYGFFLSPATYHLVANKTHYQFPSEKLRGKTKDELYDNLYFGESFTTESGEVINRNIPLDPVDFDWNEFAKQKQGFFILHTKRERRRHLIYNSFFALGAVVAFAQLLLSPGWLSITVAALYLGTFALKHVWQTRRPAVSVKRAGTGEPIPFAIIRAFVPGLDQQVKSVVADELGRFFLLTPPGEYYLTVEEKLPDESYQKIYQSEPMKLDKGIVAKDLVV